MGRSVALSVTYLRLPAACPPAPARREAGWGSLGQSV